MNISRAALGGNSYEEYEDIQMTMANTSGNAVGTWEDGATGLEDFDSSDVSMPRLTIEHTDGVFKDSQTEETFSELNVILLGLHKSRIMWPAEIGDGDADAPLCKSPDFKNGFPNVDPDIDASKRFPWEASAMTAGMLLPIMTSEGPSEGSVPCDKCRFKEWGSHPSGKTPWCSEEWTFPLLYQGEDGNWNPALFAVKRSGLKSAKKYVSPFATRKMPLFVNSTRLALDSQKRGNVRYATPVFVKAGDTDPEQWREYRDSFVSAKGYLAELPKPRVEEGTDTEVDNTWDAEVVPQAKEPVADPTPAPAAVPTPEPAAPAAPTPPPAAPAAPTPPPAAAPAAAPSAGTAELDDDEEPPF